MEELMEAIHTRKALLVDEVCYSLVSKKTKFELDKIDDAERVTPLALACSQNDVEIVSILLKYGANPNVKSTIRNRDKAPLHFICEVQEGNVEIVRKLLAAGADKDFETVDYQTPLHLACSVCNYPAAKVLLDNGADVSVLDRLGRTPLLLACYQKDLDMLQLLVEHGGMINNSDGMLESLPLSIAILHSWVPGLKYLLSKSADLTQEDFVTKAVQRGQNEMLEILLEEGANVNEASPIFGFTPLHQACMSPVSSSNILEILIKYGADVNKQCTSQNTPLHFATQNMDLHKIKILLMNDANPLVKNKRGITPLEAGFGSGSNLNKFKAYLEMFAAFGTKMSKKMGDSLRSSDRNLYISFEIQEIEQLVQSFSSNALPLLQLCRIAIRNVLDLTNGDNLTSLKNYLPSSLMSYLIFDDIVPESEH